MGTAHAGGMQTRSCMESGGGRWQGNPSSKGTRLHPIAGQASGAGLCPLNSPVEVLSPRTSECELSGTRVLAEGIRPMRSHCPNAAVLVGRGHGTHRAQGEGWVRTEVQSGRSFQEPKQRLPAASVGHDLPWRSREMTRLLPKPRATVTPPGVLGIPACRQQASALTDHAGPHLALYPGASFLQRLMHRVSAAGTPAGPRAR